jgi:sulfide:quinone oxidoreductase
VARFRIVVAGGGVAGVEGLLRLQRLLGDAAELELIAPNDDLVYRPLAVQQPFVYSGPRRYPLATIAADAGARWTPARLSSVDVDGRIARTDRGDGVEYDALLLAVGGRMLPPFPHAVVYSDVDAAATFQGMVADLEQGYLRRIAFVVPEGPVWPLPVYELALMTAQRAFSMNIDGLDLRLITPEPTPLAAFGAAAGDKLRELLDAGGIAFRPDAFVDVHAEGRLTVKPGDEEVETDAIVTVPRISGPGVPGIPGGGAHGFIPIDDHCRVPRTDGRVFAAGDAIAFPVKHGGLAAQAADTAAAAIARLAGVDVDSSPFHPVIRGMLMTGGAPLYLTAHMVAGEAFRSEVSDRPTWSPPEKIAAEELGLYLDRRDAN